MGGKTKLNDSLKNVELIKIEDQHLVAIVVILDSGLMFDKKQDNKCSLWLPLCEACISHKGKMVMLPWKNPEDTNFTRWSRVT